MITINEKLTPADLRQKIERMWALSAEKILSIEESVKPGDSSPVFTRDGRYTAQGWTEWTQGFQFGSAILQFDATGDRRFLEIGRRNTIDRMAPHVTHTGVHDHGFNNVSTYGNLRRLMLEGRIEFDANERAFYEMALKASGAIQARRWTPIADGTGYIYSFNGPHSLFADTIRSLRSLSMGHALGHALMDEQDSRVSLLKRMIDHARATARYSVYYGEGRDVYDIWGRVAHESVFNVNNGMYRCPNSQQGYSPFTTWTRGLAWVMVGFPEELEFLATLDDAAFDGIGNRDEITAMMLRAAQATCDFYIEHTPNDGIPYWDTGASGLAHMGIYLDCPAEPFNDFEPVDSSAAAIACQGLIRLGVYLGDEGKRYLQAGLTVLSRLLEEPYLSTDPKHQGLVLHSVYHRPNGWDEIPAGAKVPAGESSMWGDYHLREAALLAQRLADNAQYYTFFGPTKK